MNTYKTNNIYKSIFISFFLVVCICALYALDAPEYARCGHIGICEFLEISGELTILNSGQSLDLIDDLLFGYKTLVYEKFATFNILWTKTIIFLSQSITSFINSKTLHPFQIISISVIRC